MAQVQEVDIAAASGVADAPRLPAAVRNQRRPGGSVRRQPPKCAVRIGSLNVGTMGTGGGVTRSDIHDG